MNVLNPDQWIDRFGDLLFQYALPRVNDTLLAEDLVQDTFLSAYRSRSLFRGETSEKNWLFTILKRKIIDHYRKKSSATEALPEEIDEEEWFTESGAWRPETVPGRWERVHEDLENRELAETLEKCQNHLREKQKQVYILKYLEEMDGDEICKVLGISSSNYWILIHRARLQMRDCMEKHWFNKKNKK